MTANEETKLKAHSSYVPLLRKVTPHSLSRSRFSRPQTGDLLACCVARRKELRVVVSVSRFCGMFLVFTYIHTATLNRSRGDFQLEKKMLTNPALPEPAPKARTGERVVKESSSSRMQRSFSPTVKGGGRVNELFSIRCRHQLSTTSAS